jgi:hypothetical protein
MPGEGRLTPPESGEDEESEEEDAQQVTDETEGQSNRKGQKRKGNEQQTAVSPRPGDAEVTFICMLL